MKKFLSIALVLILALSCITGCTGQPAAPAEAAPAEAQQAPETQTGSATAEVATGEEVADVTSARDTLVMRINSDPASFDRHINTSYYAMMVQSFITSYLLSREYDESGAYGVCLTDYSLATDYAFDEDNMGVSFTLRDGVKFSDGSDLVPEDVAFSIGLQSDQSTHAFIDFANVAVQDGKVYVPFVAKDANALERLADVPIYSKAYYDACGAAEDPSVFYGEGIMSIGPYKMVEYKSGDHIYLTANEYYFAGAPKITNLQIRLITENAVALMELESNGVQILNDPDWQATSAILAGDYGDGFAAAQNASNSVQYLGFNCSDDSACGDLRVRQAICCAINRDDVLAGAYEGVCKEVNSVVSSFMEGESVYNAENWPYQYDPEKAKSLLAEAGFENGLDLTLIFSGNENRKMAAEIIANQLKNVGINVTINQGEGATIVAVMANETDNWDLFVRAFENDPCPSRYFRDYVVTNTHPQDEDFYEKYMEYVNNFSGELDADARLKVWTEFQSFYFENCLCMYPLAQSVDYMLYNTNLMNFRKLLYNNWDIVNAYFAG